MGIGLDGRCMQPRVACREVPASDQAHRTGFRRWCGLNPASWCLRGKTRADDGLIVE